MFQTTGDTLVVVFYSDTHGSRRVGGIVRAVVSVSGAYTLLLT